MEVLPTIILCHNNVELYTWSVKELEEHKKKGKSPLHVKQSVHLLTNKWYDDLAQPQHGYKPVVFRQLEAFDPESDSVMAYLEWVDVFFAANDIGPDKQVSVFLTVVGSRNYTLIKSLTAPTLP